MHCHYLSQVIPVPPPICVFTRMHILSYSQLHYTAIRFFAVSLLSTMHVYLFFIQSLPVNKQEVLADGNRFLSGKQFSGDSFHGSLRTQVIQSECLEK